jgi:alkylation response protein AidB-like acyl-CoA dehydrogenase
MAESVAAVHAGLVGLAAQWRVDRPERQARTHLDPGDFAAIRETGFLRLVVPVTHGGLWHDSLTGTRAVAEALRTMAGGDPSVALVSAMHPAVVGFWLMNPDDDQAEWTQQRDAVFAAVMDGAHWGTITSEPGSGGDMLRTRCEAVPAEDAATFLPGDAYRLTGDKHFGSGTGIADYMMTSGLPVGADEPAAFVLDMRDRPWEAGVQARITAEWDGVGMAATQSHAMRFEAIPAVMAAWTRSLVDLGLRAGPFASCLYTAVAVGVLDEAVETARVRVTQRSRSDSGLRAFEESEWARAEMDHWVARQAYEGGLRAIETGDVATAVHGALRSKQAVARLAEETMLRIGRVLGGGTFSRGSPFSHWFEDVRALGFLRPPWALAHDALFATSLSGDPEAEPS